MVVRVKVKLKYENKEVESVALANAGFESYEPEIIIPTEVARKLGIYPRLPSSVTINRYKGAGGKTFKVYRLSKGVVKAYVITEDRVVGPVKLFL